MRENKHTLPHIFSSGCYLAISMPWHTPCWLFLEKLPGQTLSDRFWNTMPSLVVVSIPVTKRPAWPTRCSKRFPLANIVGISQRERRSSFMPHHPGMAFLRGSICGSFLTIACFAILPMTDAKRVLVKQNHDGHQVRLGGKSFQEQRSDHEQKPYYFLLHVLPPISLPKFRLWNKKIYTRNNSIFRVRNRAFFVTGTE